MFELRDKIIGTCASTQSESVLQPLELGGRRQNELLFFLKPECFLTSTQSQQADLVETVMRRFDEFGCRVCGCVVIRGPKLRADQIMDRHYGFINGASRDVVSILGPGELAALRAAVGANPETPILGGHEFLAAHPMSDEKSLDALWASRKARKLRSGLYFESYVFEDQPVILVNGFHPAQLAHFTRDDRKIVLMVLESEMPWKVLRSTMLGDTFPERAVADSIRRTLYENPQRFGLADVSIANNCSHLSAGPFEALFELWNFLGSSRTADFKLDHTRMWKLAGAVGVREADVLRALENPVAQVGGERRSLFDATEELDSCSSAHLFARMFCGNQKGRDERVLVLSDEE